MSRNLLSDDEIWRWHQIIEECHTEWRERKATKANYCREHGIDYKKFMQNYRTHVYIQYTNPELYSYLKPLCEERISLGIPVLNWAKKHNLRVKDISEMTSHLRVLDVINRFKTERDGGMKFIQVPQVQSTLPVIEEPEVLKKQNDVELMISAGVKVVVAPEVGADKLVRIIELLKDL